MPETSGWPTFHLFRGSTPWWMRALTTPLATTNDRHRAAVSHLVWGEREDGSYVLSPLSLINSGCRLTGWRLAIEIEEGSDPRLLLVRNP